MKMKVVLPLLLGALCLGGCASGEEDSSCPLEVTFNGVVYDGYSTESSVPVGDALDGSVRRDCDDGNGADGDGGSTALNVSGVDEDQAIAVEGEPTTIYVSRSTPVDELPASVRDLVSR
jgi:hypothetical protein